jgi:hypothetical protein
VLRKIFGPKRDGVTREWRELHNEELNDLCSPNIIRSDQIKKNEMGRACGTCGDRRGADRVLVKRSDGKRQLGRPRLRRENYIKIYLQDLEWGGVDWIDLAEYKEWAVACESGNKLSGIFFLTICQLVRKDFASWN